MFQVSNLFKKKWICFICFIKSNWFGLNYRSFPGNLIALTILTLSIGYMTMMFCSYHKTVSVLLCLAITTVCCIGIIIFASQTKYDLTRFVKFFEPEFKWFIYLALLGLINDIYFTKTLYAKKAKMCDLQKFG